MTLQDAIRNSSNPTAVRTAIKLTLPASYAFMTENLSFTTLTNDDMTAAGALALGGLSKGVTTREMAAAYASFARGAFTPRRERIPRCLTTTATSSLKIRPSPTSR